MSALQLWRVTFKCVKPAGIDLAFISKRKIMLIKVYFCRKDKFY